MMRRLSLAVVLVIVLAMASMPAAADQISGEAVFNQYCVYCHADSREAPGTIQLTKRRGAENAVLAERDDLVPAYIEVVVRRGLNAMPPFAPSDLDAEKLQALIEYLTRKN